MKRKLIPIIFAIFCIALLLVGCVSTQSEDSSASVSVTSSVKSSTDSGVSLVSDTEENSELFSDRDISAEYDDIVVTIELTGSGATSSSNAVEITGSDVTITSAGTYVISGTLQNGSIIVNATKDDKIQLVLSGVNINSNTYAPIYVKQADKVFVTLDDGTENVLTNGGSFVQTDDNNVDAVVFAKDDVTFNGTGTLTITSPAGHGIVGKDEVTITNGTYAISASSHAIRANDTLAIASGTFSLTAQEDGLHAENSDDETLGNIYIEGGTFTIRVNDDAIHANTLLQIDNGTFDITAAEGLEATYVLINNGTVNISASDDGINAARKSSSYTPTVEINGGDITITMGAGDTDGIDSNYNLIITGGTIDITGQSPFDYDGSAQYTGGTLIVNGQQVSSITNQMMGGGGFGQEFSGKGGLR